jgi:hypothetical protein
MRGLRTYLVVSLCTGAIILAAGCGSDLTTQPGQQDQQTPRLLTPNPIGSHARIGDLPAGQYYVKVTFTIDPNASAYIAIGPHYLYIPANSVCDPTTSGYGVGTWTLPCASLTKPITVTARASLYNGHPLVEFDTHLRFRPTTDTRYDVMLYLRDDRATSASTITWCPESSAYCVDEAKLAFGSQLETRFDPAALYVYRKIEHFSGYNVTGGREGCDPLDIICLEGEGL